MTWSGSKVSTSSIASTMVARMFSNCRSNSASVRVGAFGMRKPRTWLVTPGGRMASYSGCTEVLVEGTSTPSFRRQPSVSAISAVLLAVLLPDGGGALAAYFVQTTMACPATSGPMRASRNPASRHPAHATSARVVEPPRDSRSMSRLISRPRALVRRSSSTLVS
jgi:hypothetical protein